MAKIDIRHAYRNVPVHPDDRHLLAMQWNNEILIDKVLPFGLRSAPLIFTAIADALQWIIEQRGVHPILHYLDDYITIGPPDSTQCSHNLHVLKQTCEDLGVPLEASKSEGPTSRITFLGLPSARVIRLPEDKLARLCRLLEDWGNRKATRKRDLLSLIGHLQHAAKAVRQLIPLGQLNVAARSDTTWWRTFAQQWTCSTTTTSSTHTSGSWGCAAFASKAWFQFQWPSSVTDWHIAAKEMTP